MTALLGTMMGEKAEEEVLKGSSDTGHFNLVLLLLFSFNFIHLEM